MNHVGQCLCGTVRYEVDGPFQSMTHCHCSMCRKHHGAPFATYVSASLAGFRWVSGQDNIEKYTTESGGTRSFCRTCGSVTPIFMDAHALVLFFVCFFDGELCFLQQKHIFIGSKASFFK